MKTLIALLIILTTQTVLADSAEFVKVDLDKKENKIVEAAVANLYTYNIDPKACICWAHMRVAGNPMTTIDCKKLAAYPELAQYVKECK